MTLGSPKVAVVTIVILHIQAPANKADICGADNVFIFVEMCHRCVDKNLFVAVCDVDELHLDTD